MSRSGYSYNCDGWALIRWRGAVASSIRGRGGQAFLHELLDAMDAMPEKRLIKNSFGEPGAHCTLGVIGASRGIEMPRAEYDEFDDYDSDLREQVKKALHIPGALAAEIMFLNDYDWRADETPEQRWSRMREWVRENIKEPP